MSNKPVPQVEEILPVLGYWDIRGQAQAIRYQLVFQGITFEDFYYNHTTDRESRNDWLTQKAVSGLDFPNLPYFIDGDFKITEHMAIHRYIAQKWMPQLLGKDLEQKAKVDMLAGVLWDLKRVSTMGCYTDGDRPLLIQQTMTQFQPVAAFLKGKMFLLGNDLCFLDFYLFELLQLVNFTTNGEIYETNPHLD